MEITAGNILFAFAVTLLAGLSTGISGTCFYTKQTDKSSYQARSGFLRCNDLCIFRGILPKLMILSAPYMVIVKLLGNTACFFGGILVIALIDRFVPSGENPHEIRDVTEMTEDAAVEAEEQQLLRMGLFSALAIAIHNFPEGIATFISAIQDPALGVSIAIAIAIHNIPEGIAVSVPIYYATGSKKRAFLYSFLSGLSEPLGAIVGYFVLMRFINDVMFGIVFAMVAGIMVYISLDELLPTAEKYGFHHLQFTV